MRGSLGLNGATNNALGIIPAYAGLTRPLVGAPNGRRDHPRACGAHFFSVPLLMRKPGSSPRMRGSLTAAIAAICAAGIIPAHAGLTECILSQVGGLRDHPRACGAHSASPIFVRALMGSSPRMRGSHYESGRKIPDEGIIPAHAGLTRSSCRKPPVSWDHPRACGAH